MYILYQKVELKRQWIGNKFVEQTGKKKRKDNKNSRDYTLSLNLARSLLLLLSFCIPRKNKVLYFFILLLLSIHPFLHKLLLLDEYISFLFCILKPSSLLYILLLLRLFLLVLISLVWVYSFSFLFFSNLFPGERRKFYFLHTSCFSFSLSFSSSINLSTLHFAILNCETSYKIHIDAYYLRHCRFF